MPMVLTLPVQLTNSVLTIWRGCEVDHGGTGAGKEEHIFCVAMDIGECRVARSGYRATARAAVYCQVIF